MSDHLLAWHWLREDRKLGYDDGREVKVGETLTVDVTPVLCEAGLHASERAIDSLGYAPGPIVCRVVLSGTVVRGTDKATATERTVLAMANATRTLGEWSCDCAERALLREREKGREPDARSWAALEVKRMWLRGEATDEELDAARDAARDAAWAAARDAAWDAAWDAEVEWQNAHLEELLLALLGLEKEAAND